MNSLNILSSRVIGPASSSSRARSHSSDDLRKAAARDELNRNHSFHDYKFASQGESLPPEGDSDTSSVPTPEPTDVFPEDDTNEKTALLPYPPPYEKEAQKSSLRQALKRLIVVLTESTRVLLSYIGAPAVYVLACFQDHDGSYSAFVPVKRLSRLVRGTNTARPSKNGRSSVRPVSAMTEPSTNSEKGTGKARVRKLRTSSSNESLSSSIGSESDADPRGNVPEERRAKPRPQKQRAEETSQNRRSIRIKLNSNESFQERRKQRSAKAQSSEVSASSESQLTVDTIKSPTSPSSLKITKYPQTQAPPRPLIPRRQPSYTAAPTSLSTRRSSLRSSNLQQKTLILDLDETLIHSLAKGGRMSSGHMVEVKLNVPVGVPGSGVIGPQHPILYYVHKRPHCDEFLRKVCKWYKLVVFTASVQEYADPVIDWLEQERKFFSARYYRQHCTFRNGAYIKDLSSVEPDLSRVCILDNSPMSYIFHEDNAIPIEGWINDPTDNDLLHLIPMLEALQYVMDVRAFLALRRGEAEAQGKS